MRSFFPLASSILFGVIAVCAHAQGVVLPTNPQPNLRQEQFASLTPNRVTSNPTIAESSPGPHVLANNSLSTTNTSAQETQTICGITKLGRCLRDLGEDEKAIFTSPLRLQPKDGYWLAPLGAATGLAIAYDADASEAVGVDPSRTNTANTIADFGSFIATGAEGAGIYFIGLAKKDPKLAETGRLADEAIIDSGTVTLVTKLATNRQRPAAGKWSGRFLAVWHPALGMGFVVSIGSRYRQHGTGSSDCRGVPALVCNGTRLRICRDNQYGAHFRESTFPVRHPSGTGSRVSYRQLCSESSLAVSARGEEDTRQQNYQLSQSDCRSANAYPGGMDGDSRRAIAPVLGFAAVRGGSDACC